MTEIFNLPSASLNFRHECCLSEKLKWSILPELIIYLFMIAPPLSTSRNNLAQGCPTPGPRAAQHSNECGPT